MMSIITTWVCDRCKKTSKTNNELCGIYFVFEQRSGYNKQHLNADWCEPCCIELGVIIKGTEQPAKQPPPTLEDFLREIVREEIENANQ